MLPYQKVGPANSTEQLWKEDSWRYSPGQYSTLWKGTELTSRGGPIAMCLGYARGEDTGMTIFASSHSGCSMAQNI